MKASFVQLLFTMCFLYTAKVFSAPEIWLLSGKNCNVCELFNEVRQQREYGEELLFEGNIYPIRNLDKASLPQFLTAALEEEIQSRYWDLQLTVAIVENQNLLFQGNIAQSADFSQAFLKREYMAPKRDVTLDELHDYGFNYLEFFKQQFNLEYFLNVALNNQPPRKDNELKFDLSPEHHGTGTTISIWGSAMQPATNGLFISARINQLVQKFKDFQPKVIFGHGKGSVHLDTLMLKDEKYTFVKAPVKADYSASHSGLENWFSAVKHSNTDNHLIIQVGHSGPNGSPLWGHALPVNQTLLKTTLKDTEKDTIFVSGACHGGLFAKAASCGFYAAHPAAIATGCQTSHSAIAASDDYLKFFFTEEPGRDLNNDEKVTFSEAHWYASANLEHHNISYTDKDAIIDDYFSQHPEHMQNAISLKSLKALSHLLTNEENDALTQLSSGLPEETKIDLLNYVQKHKAAIETLKGKTELSSLERNKVTALNYPLNLVMLARRAIYMQQKPEVFKELAACENTVINEFIQNQTKSVFNTTTR